MNAPRFRRGFTLVELLAVIAVTGLLGALLLPALAKSKNRALMVEEISAARQLMLGAQMYSEDWGGAMFPGYFASARAVDDQGKPLFFPENARYPWRIIPYMSGSMRLIYSGANQLLLDQLQSGSRSSYVYDASLFPSLGVNSYFIGGNQSEFPAAAANATFGAGTVITAMAQASRPGDLMVFMSARSDVNGSNAQGYYQVTPPFVTGREWAAAFSPSTSPDQWGFAAPRFDYRAVAALLDGHTETFNLAQMQDMRHWCNLADRADWTLTP
jgi:prepilin-type N-terminal cleavage/methylation domain-containing protein